MRSKPALMNRSRERENQGDGPEGDHWDHDRHMSVGERRQPGTAQEAAQDLCS